MRSRPWFLPAKLLVFALHLHVYLHADDTIEFATDTFTANEIMPWQEVQLGARSRATVAIHNSFSFRVQEFVSPPIRISGEDFSISEDPRLNPPLTIERVGNRDQTAEVDVVFRTTDRTQFALILSGHLAVEAQAGRDFNPMTNRVTFLPGEAVREIPFPVIDNATVDLPNRHFQVQLIRRDGEVEGLPDHESVVRIQDNEHRPGHDLSGYRSLPPIQFVPEPAQRVIPLPDGTKLAVGRFTHVNGVERQGLCRITADGELDETFRPPAGILIEEMQWHGSLLAGGLIELVHSRVFETPLLIQSAGGILIKRPGLLRLLPDGSRDESFRSPFTTGVRHLAESADGSFWATIDHSLFHLSATGSILSSNAVVLVSRFDRQDREIVGVQDGGKVLILTAMDHPETHVVVRLLRDGALDPAFRPIGSAAGAVRVMEDQRLIGFTHANLHTGYVRIFSPDGEPDASFPPLALEWPFNGGGVAGALASDQLWFEFGPFGRSAYRLSNAPATSLTIHAWIRYSEDSKTRWFEVTFRRLGTSSRSATAHYRTRDLSARAGRDYIAQSGTLDFAPLETEKTIRMPILADERTGFDETLEFVVTTAEGIEELPAPWLATIPGDLARRSTPSTRLNRIRKLRDGRVLVGSPAPGRIEASPDLKNWRPPTNLLEGADWNGNPVWLDASATNAATRYYRAVTP